MYSSVDSIRRVVVRDLATLRDQINAYEDESDIWRLVPGIANPPGTLALHLAGNLQHFIGHLIGGSGYVRDREAEFARRDVPASELVAGLEAAIEAVDRALRAVDDTRLEEPYPQEIMGAQLTTGQFLIHLTTHLAYHLGQVDYHRRILTGQGAVAGAQSIPVLAKNGEQS